MNRRLVRSFTAEDQYGERWVVFEWEVSAPEVRTFDGRPSPAVSALAYQLVDGRAVLAEDGPGRLMAVAGTDLRLRRRPD